MEERTSPCLCTEGGGISLEVAKPASHPIGSLVGDRVDRSGTRGEDI